MDAIARRQPVVIPANRLRPVGILISPFKSHPPGQMLQRVAFYRQRYRIHNPLMNIYKSVQQRVDISAIGAIKLT